MSRHRGPIKIRSFMTQNPIRLREQKGYVPPPDSASPEHDIVVLGHPDWCTAANAPWFEDVCTHQLGDRMLDGGLCRESCDAAADDEAHRPSSVHPPWCDAANAPWSAEVCESQLTMRMLAGTCHEVCGASVDDASRRF